MTYGFLSPVPDSREFKKSVAAGAAKVEAVSFDPHRRVHVVESKLEHMGLDTHACSLKAIARDLQKFAIEVKAARFLLQTPFS